MGPEISSNCYKSPPRRTVSLDDYIIRTPQPPPPYFRKKSKLCKELQEYDDEDDEQGQCGGEEEGEGDCGDDGGQVKMKKKEKNQREKSQQRISLEAGNPPATLAKAQENKNVTLLQPHTSPPRSSIVKLPAKLPPKPQLHPAAQPASTTSFAESLPSDPLACFYTPLLRRYLAMMQTPLGSVAAQEQQGLIRRQAEREQQRLCQGLDPRSYQAKGRVISTYICGDVVEEWKLGTAIEVIHAPLGFPNQEVWLWEVRRWFENGMATGTVVVFRIVWEMQDNHWEVVDVRW